MSFFLAQRQPGTALWRETTHDARQLRHKANIVLTKLRRVGLASAWGRWVEFTAEMHRIVTVTQRVVARVLLTLQSSAFDGWVRKVSD